MATSGTFNTTAWTSSQGLGTRYLTFSWTRTSTSVANNTSTIHYTLKGGGTYDGTDYGWVRTRNISLKINGVTVYSSGSGGAPSYVDLTRVMTVTSGDFTIAHNADGTKTFSAEASAGIESTSNVKTGSGSWTLDPIARKSDFTITPPNFTVGDTVAINISRANTSFTHDIFIQRSDGLYYDAVAQGVGTSFSWNTGTVPGGSKPLISCFASGSKTYTANVLVRTWNGNALVGDVTHQFTATMPENANTKPNASLSWAIHSGDTPAGNNVPIQTLNRIDFTITASGKYNATIASVRVEFDGKTYTPTLSNGIASFTSDAITGSGSLVATVVVTDSRGFTKTATSEIEVAGYYSPAIVPITGATSVEVYRCDEFGDRAVNGEYAHAKVARRYADVYIGDIHNSAAMYWRSRVSGTAWQDNWVTLLGDGGHNDDYDLLLLDENHDPAFFTKANAFDIEIMIRDSIESKSSIVFSIPSESVPLHLAEGGAGVGLGAYALPIPNSVRVGWDTYFDGDIYIYDSASQEYITLAQYIQNVINP